MACTTFPSTGLVPNVTTHVVGNVTYRWTGSVWEAITAPLKHSQLSELSPGDGSAHHSTDILTDEDITLQTKLNLLRDFDGRKFVTNRSNIPALNDNSISRILTSDRSELFSVQDSVYGATNVPDIIEMSNGKFAVRSGQYKSKRLGVYSTGDFGHRAGPFLYKKTGVISAELLTDLSRFKPETNSAFVPSVQYLDQVAGVQGADGLTWATAEKRWAEVIAKNPDIVYIRGGILNGPSRITSFNVSKDMAIIGVGSPVIVGPLQGGTWSKEGGYTNVYRKTTDIANTNTSNIFDTSCVDAYGAAGIMVKLATIEEVDVTPNSWYQDPVTFNVLVHTRDSRALSGVDNTLVISMVSGTNVVATFTGNYKLYVENVQFWGGLGSAGPGAAPLVVKDNGSVYSKSVFYNKNCGFAAGRGSFSNGLTVRGIALCISDGSFCILNERDGFNYHNGLDPNGGGTGSSQSPHFVEVDCFAASNGWPAPAYGNNQGSTSHDECHGFRINSVYQGHLDGGNVVDIDGTKCWMVGITARRSAIVGVRLSTTRSASLNTGEWWIDGLSVTENSGNPSYSFGDLSIDGDRTIVHMEDVISDKPAAVGLDVVSVDSIL